MNDPGNIFPECLLYTQKRTDTNLKVEGLFRVISCLLGISDIELLYIGFAEKGSFPNPSFRIKKINTVITVGYFFKILVMALLLFVFY